MLCSLELDHYTVRVQRITGFFKNLNYPPVNEVGKSDQMVMKEKFVCGQQMETIDFYHGKEAPLKFDQTQNTPLERANQN